MPLPAMIILLVIVAMAIGLLLTVVASDRKRRATRSSNVDGAWIGKPGICTTTIRLELERGEDRSELQRFAADAIRAVGGVGLMTGDDVLIGWTLTPLLGLGWAPQEVAIKFSSSGSNTLLDCASRPRYATTLGDARRNRVVARKLADAFLSSSGRNVPT